MRERSQATPGRPTVDDVAAAAGVSRATAARVLGGYGRVSQATRSRVRQHAEALGYTPNRLAQGMVTGRTQTLGFVSADMQNPFFGQTMRGFTDFARSKGYDVVVANSEEDPQLERRAVQTLLERRVDGMVVAPTELRQAAHLDDVVASSVPIVLVDRSVRGLAADCVLIDNVSAARDAVKHLIERGHRRIGVATTHLLSDDLIAELDEAALDARHAQTTVARAVGYVRAMRAAALPVVPELIANATYNRPDAYRAVRALLALPKPPTAVLAVDDLLTLAAFEAVQDSGLRFPGECTVLGFDDLDWTTIVRPRLTVVAQPAYDIGATAARRLLARIDGDTSPAQTLLLEAKLVERESTAQAPVKAGRGRRPAAAPHRKRTEDLEPA
ncbi:MAG TPA: LacI family DNA-binding transcriptional regulator [Mycobacteriales bacterium]|nr:LacI family DNA-binding transcriptional regulator [Mycobacteriales bacterium]